MDSDIAELLAWAAQQDNLELVDYVLDLLFDAASEIQNRGGP